jgi:glycosyltransferase involved in cell wall biosynthesis
MKIGFDAKRLFHNWTGLGYYSRTLIQNLATLHPEHQYFLFDSQPVHNELTRFFFDHPSIQVIKTTGPGFLSRSFLLDWQLASYQLDLFHGLSNELPFIRQATSPPRIVTIHDILFKSFPADFPWADRQVYELKTRSALRTARAIIAISEATRQAISEYYSVESHRLFTIYQAYDPLFDQPVSAIEVEAIRHKYRLPASFVLYVGSITYRKNLQVVLEALARIYPGNRPYVVVAGKGASYESKMKQFVANHHLADYVTFLPGIPRSDIRTLYSAAEISVYPSLGEGFGLPVIESLAAHTPVITSSISSMPEAGGKLAFYFDPGNADALVEKLLTIEKKVWQVQNLESINQHLEKFRAHTVIPKYMQCYEACL